MPSSLPFRQFRIALALLLLLAASAATNAQNRLQNLGPNVNSRLGEISPVLSPDGKTLYFSRSVPDDPNNIDRDIRRSRLGANGLWGPSQEMPGTLNNDGWNAVCGFTADGMTMLLAGRYMPDGTLKGGFSLSTLVNGEWTTPVPLEIPDLPLAYDTQTACLSADGSTLLFSSNMRYGGQNFGGFDLFASQRLEDGSWSSPANLGPRINSPGYETSPFLAADGRTLYFSTDGRGGLGGNDIFISRREGDGWEQWTEPANLGPLVNTPQWESYINVSFAGAYAYVGSTAHSLGGMDIFRVALPRELKPLDDGPRPADPPQQPEPTVAEEPRANEAPTPPAPPEPPAAGAPRLVNLGTAVNTWLSEMAPLISADGKTLFFARSVAQDWQNTDRDIFAAQILPDGRWTDARRLGNSVNNRGWNIPCAVTADGNTLLVTGTYTPDGGLAGGFSLVHREGDAWGRPIPLDIEGYPFDEETQSGTMSMDGKAIIFSSYKRIGPDFHGTTDLYVTQLRPDGKWSQPQNLGPVVNTRGYETTPFLAADSRTLYFSSNGHGGFGSQDILATRRVGNSWTNWTVPENLGPEVNTPDWEAYFTITGDGQRAYVGSREQTVGMMDIFRVDLRQVMGPDPLVIVSGTVLDQMTGQPVRAAAIEYIALDDSLSLAATVHPQTGEYSLVLTAGHNYSFHASAEGYIGASENLDLRDLDAFGQLDRDLRLTPLVPNARLPLNNVYFSEGRDIILDASFPELQRILAVMGQYPSLKVEIAGHSQVGHTDPGLSQKRANAIKRYLIGQGVAPDRVIAVGYADRFPAVPTPRNNRENAQNRRVEFVILSI